MDDVLHCPICGNKLKTNHHTNKLLHPTGKTVDYAERICSEWPNHILAIWTDKASKKVDLLKFSLNPKYSRFLEIDYVNQKCRIICTKEGEIQNIEIPKMIEPDFPDLEKLKERVSLYVVFS
jgi:uncharacterized protein YbaR (Trm112 family)